MANNLDAKYYWRDGEKEVDFLISNKTIIPVEVKESKEINSHDLRHLIFVMKKFNLKESMLIYSGEEGEIKKENMLIKNIPLWKLFVDSKI